MFHPYCHASPVVVGQDRFGDLAAPGKGQAMGVQEDEITVLGSMAVLNSFAAAADLMAAGVVDTGPMLGSLVRPRSVPRGAGQRPQRRGHQDPGRTGQLAAEIVTPDSNVSPASEATATGN